MVSRGKMLTGRHLKAGLHCENVGIRGKIKTKVSPNVCKIKIDKTYFYFESTLFCTQQVTLGISLREREGKKEDEEYRFPVRFEDTNGEEEKKGGR